jgi:hypothetical protein
LRFALNSALCAAVQVIAGPRWRSAQCVALFALAIGLSSCVDVDGGAIELSWTLRTFDGEVIASNRDEACRRARLESVRVCWQPLSAGVDAGEGRRCAAARSREFACGEDRGVTRFEVEPGPTAIWLEPLCVADLEPPEPGTYEVPAPIVRDIREGEVAALRALLIVATDGDQDCPPAGCTCAR